MSLPTTARWGSNPKPPVTSSEPITSQPIANIHEPSTETKKSKKVVLDSGAIILGGRIERLGDEFWTIQEVLSEIKDENARLTLNSLPFELHVREVDPAALAFVTKFSKLTGDFPKLSKTDLKVMALTYQLEKQFNGIDHLRTNPLPVCRIEFFFQFWACQPLLLRSWEPRERSPAKQPHQTSRQ